MKRVVILMQENKTPDFYFPTLSSWGANIQNRGSLLKTPPLPVLRSIYLAVVTFTPSAGGDITAAHETGRDILLVQSVLGFAVLGIGVALVLPRIGEKSATDGVLRQVSVDQLVGAAHGHARALESQC